MEKACLPQNFSAFWDLREVQKTMVTAINFDRVHWQLRLNAYYSLFIFIFNDSDSDPTCLSSGLLNASLPVWILIPMLIPTESAWRIPSGNRQRR